MDWLLLYIPKTIAIGVGATLVMDSWALAQKRLFGVPSLDYAMVGRWIGHFRNGRFRHDRIAEASPVSCETAIGWAAHYAIGIAFAVLLLIIAGPGWAIHPTFGPAIGIGLITLAAPYLLMQPGMGAGIAGARTPRPWIVRGRSLVAHTVYGVGLYISGLIVSLFPAG